jgi:hypothetical protein
MPIAFSRIYDDMRRFKLPSRNRACAKAIGCSAANLGAIHNATKKVAVVATLPKEAFWQAIVRGGAFDTR